VTTSAKHRIANDPRPAGRRKVQGFPCRSAGVGAAVSLLLLASLVLLVRSDVNGGGSRANPPPATVQAATLAQGQPAPDFSAATLQGSRLSLSSLRGRPVLINFFASWCTVCEVELPGIEQAYQEHQASGFTVVGVNTLENGDGLAFYRRLRLTFPAVYDPGNPGRIGSAYGVTQGLPASVFVDRAGTVQLVQYGPVTKSLIDQELAKL
jgi:cytochrome c biogenesis protein CcmG, thiol:disulfide interchange protein DsbE